MRGCEIVHTCACVCGYVCACVTCVWGGMGEGWWGQSKGQSELCIDLCELRSALLN